MWEDILRMKDEMKDGCLFIPINLRVPYVDFIIVDSVRKENQPRVLLVNVTTSIVNYHLKKKQPKCQKIFDDINVKSRWLKDLLEHLLLTENVVEFIYLTAIFDSSRADEESLLESIGKELQSSAAAKRIKRSFNVSICSIRKEYEF
jgi:hypothetical protein